MYVEAYITTVGECNNFFSRKCYCRYVRSCFIQFITTIQINGIIKSNKKKKFVWRHVFCESYLCIAILFYNLCIRASSNMQWFKFKVVESISYKHPIGTVGMWNILKWLLVVFLNAYIIYKLIGKPMANIFSLYFVLKITRIHLVISADMNREHYSVYDFFFFVVEKKSIEMVSYCNAHEESPAFPFICNAIVFVLNFLWVYGYGNIIFFSCFREDESIDSSLIISHYKFIKVDSGHGISDCYWLQVILPKDITMTPYWEKIRFHPKVPFHFESLIRLFVLFVFSLFCIGFSVCFVYFAFVPTTHFSNFFRCKICQELLTHYRTLFIGCIIRVLFFLMRNIYVFSFVETEELMFSA